ncbi:MAG: hypothetical protein IT539_11015 [Bradyrhizobiaceae bacterium]|nr:hypothetical protein [Bradyrhizobiaceae bacterium]
MISNVPRRRAVIAYLAAMVALGSLMTIVALGGGPFSAKRSASDLSHAQMTILKQD